MRMWEFVRRIGWVTAAIVAVGCTIQLFDRSVGYTVATIGFYIGLPIWIVGAYRIVRGPHPVHTYLQDWRNGLPIEKWSAPPRQGGRNPHLAKRGDWMYDKGDGDLDLVFDAARVSVLTQEKIQVNRSFARKIGRRGSWYEAMALDVFGWIPRNQILNYGYGNNPIWDPEQRQWFNRNEVPQKPGYMPPIQDTSTGDGSGA